MIAKCSRSSERVATFGAQVIPAVDVHSHVSLAVSKRKSPVVANRALEISEVKMQVQVIIDARGASITYGQLGGVMCNLALEISEVKMKISVAKKFD